MMAALLVPMALLACMAPAGSAGEGATYYVAPGGSDGDDGSAGSPFATIQKAADIVTPGDTVIVRDGVYTQAGAEDCAVAVRCAGTAERPITFRAEHKWGAVLDGVNDTVKYGWSFEKGARYITMEGFELREFAHCGINSNAGAHHITVRGCHVHHIGNVETTTQYGLDGIFDGAEARYHVYDGNVFHDIGRTGPPTVLFSLDHGIYTCGKHNVITNNVFYHLNAGWGVQVAGYQTVDDLVISNNTFAYGNKRGHIVLWLPCHNVLIQNNIFYQPAVENAINFCEADLKSVVMRNNLVFGGGLKDDEDNGLCQVSDTIVGRDPLLADPAKGDFQVRPGSPAIDAGVAEQAPATDIAGTRRPQGRGYDLGAYEWQPPQP